MKTLHIAKRTGATLACAFALAAGAPALQVRPLAPVQGENPAQSEKPLQAERAPEGTAQAFDAATWKTKLTQKDLDARERALDEFTALARASVEARAALDDWAKDNADLELAWTSRMARRALQQSPAFGRAPFTGTGDPWDSLREEFERLSLHLGDLQGQLDDFFVPPPALGQPGLGIPGHGGFDRSSESFSMQVGPDGVKVKVSEDIDGERVDREYEAATVEELLATHPELRPHLRGVRRGSQLESFPDLFRRVPRTDVLGILCAPLTAERQQALGLQDGQGLHVEQTWPGTLAAALGIQARDVLLELDGEVIESAEDVGRILRARKADAEVTAIVMNEAKERRTLTWRPPAAPAPTAGVRGSTLK